MFKKGDTVLISKKSRSKYRGKIGKIVAIEPLGKVHVTVDMGGGPRPTTISKQMLTLTVVEKKEVPEVKKYICVLVQSDFMTYEEAVERVKSKKLSLPDSNYVLAEVLEIPELTIKMKKV